jgi:hypothetical protein
MNTHPGTLKEVAMASVSTQVKVKGRRTSAPGSPPPTVRIPSLRVYEREAGSEGVSYRVVVALGGSEEIDVTGALTAPLAHALWQLRSGADIGNWVDAERLLDGLLRSFENVAAPSVVIPRKREKAAR